MPSHRRLACKLNYFQSIILLFAMVILIGAVLLMLPISAQGHTVTPFHEALFTATSAVCVTGLVVRDTASHWSAFGQAVLMVLIQIGGLGVITVGASFSLLSGRRISLSQRGRMQEAMSAPTGGARVEGIHLEGPFLSKNYRGGQWERYLQTPSVEKLRHYYEASGGTLRIMTLAPECENGLDVVREAKNLGVAIALGHTGADFDTAKAAVDCGASMSTHTFNGMVPFHHRTPGVLGEVLTDDRISCEVIADFVHLHPATVLLICRAKGMDRVHLVSDSMFATGLPDGDYPEEDRVRHIRNGACVLDDGRISGSTYPVAFGMRNLVKIGIPLEQAVMAASRNPARDAGILGHTGTLTPGKRADLVLLKDDLFPAATFVDGEPVFTAEGVRL